MTLLRISTPRAFDNFLFTSEVELHINEEIVEAVAGNQHFSEGLIQLLLQDWEVDFPITESAVEGFVSRYPAVVRSRSDPWTRCINCDESFCGDATGREALALLIKHNKAKTSMTEGAVECILKSADKGLVEQLIEKG